MMALKRLFDEYFYNKKEEDIMTVNEIKGIIRGFLGKYIMEEYLDDQKDLFKEGHLNSLFALQLVLFVEKTFNIKVGNEDLGIENFNSINSITDFVKLKLEAIKN